MAHNLDSSFVRDQNRNLVLSVLRARRSLTRAELAKETNLSYPTVAGILRDLLTDGFVTEARANRRGSGRIPMGVEFHPDARLVVGVDLNAQVPRAVLADLDGTLLGEPLSAETITNGLDLIPAVENLVAGLLSAHGVPEGRLVGIGVALRGTLDLARELVYFMEFGQPVNLVGRLRERFGVPVLLDHNYNAALLAEYLYGAARQRELVLRVNVGTGISAGILVHGEVYRGSGGNAGEMGHATVDVNGPVCPSCGRRGCLETYASARAIARRAGGLGPAEGRYTGESKVDALVLDVARQALAGEAGALEIMDQAASALGEGISNSINVLNPELVIIDGSVVRAYPPLIERVKEKILSTIWPASREHITVETSGLVSHPMLTGAVALVLHEFFRVSPGRSDVNVDFQQISGSSRG